MPSIRKIGCYLNRYYIQTFNFIYYYYICLLINPSIFYLLTNIFNVVFNSFYRIAFYKKHNRVLTSIINRTQNTEEILSFEENPILNIVYDGAEKELELLCDSETDSENSYDDSDNSYEDNTYDLLNLND